MIKYILRKILFEDNKAYGKYYAYPVVEQMVDLNGLAQHMSEHNTPFSAGAIKGVLTDMVKCIKELLLESRSVKIDDLAVFSLGIINQVGADTPEDFSVTKNIKGLKLRAQGTGELIAKNLNGSFRRVTVAASGSTATVTNPEDDGEGGNGGSNEGGSNGSNGSQQGSGSNENQNQTPSQGASETPAQSGDFTITAAVGNDGGGSVTIKKNGVAVEGSSVQASASDSIVLTAVEDSGYQFLGWADGNSDNPRTITPSADATFTASFMDLSNV